MTAEDEAKLLEAAEDAYKRAKNEGHDTESAREAAYLAIIRGTSAQIEAQLPEGMKHCTILSKQCSLGHGWLTATNWVEHGCPTCELRKAESERDAIQAQVERASDLLAGVRAGLKYDAVAEDRALMLARAALSTPPAEIPPTKRKRSIHDDRTCGACDGPLETSRDAVCESCTPEADAHVIALSMAPAANPPAVPGGSPSDADFVTARNTLAGSPGAASYNDALNALLRLALKAGKWDAAVNRLGQSSPSVTACFVLHGDEKDGGKS